MACQIVAILMTLRDLQGHVPNSDFLKCDFLNSYATVDKISTDIVWSLSNN